MQARTIALLFIIALVFLVAPVPVAAQKPGKVYRIGWLGGRPDDKTYFDPFLKQLHALGWIEGQDFVMVYELMPFDQIRKQAPKLAAKLIQRNVDIIVTVSTPATLAAKKATSTIPIVSASFSRPVQYGIIESLAHPGGNVTGVVHSPPRGFVGKRLALLKEAVPTVSRVAFIHSPYKPGDMERITKGVPAIGQKLGLTVFVTFVKDTSDYADVFATIIQKHAEALYVSYVQYER